MWLITARVFWAYKSAAGGPLEDISERVDAFSYRGRSLEKALREMRAYQDAFRRKHVSGGIGSAITITLLSANELPDETTDAALEALAVRPIETLLETLDD